MSLVLTLEQSEALKVIKTGHNVVVTGQAGTGKSVLVKEAYRRLISCHKKVAVTASTGIAARQFQKESGSTLHHWAGLDDGRHSNKEILKLLQTDLKSTAYYRIKNTDVLIIDEISMISKRIFEQLEYVCRHIKDPSLYFGNLQVVCFGDFYQLSPVPNSFCNDPGHHVFTSEIWKQVIAHTVQLTKVLRQSDTKLITAINELERGIPSPETNNLMETLSRPLPPGNEPCVLYGTNFEVDCYNATMLLQIPGDVTVYTSQDQGDPKFLKKIKAKKILSLKLHVPVMLLKNLTADLVNGLLGNIVKLETDGPTVKFQENIIKLTMSSFTIYDAVNCKIVASRVQYPISLSFSMTVHKSQGLTLPRLIVNCKNINQPGQVGVAIGRSVNTEGLCVQNYTPSCSKLHRKVVGEFYEQGEVQVYEDQSCCKKVFIEEDIGEDFTSSLYLGVESDESDFDENDLQLIDEFEKRIERDDGDEQPGCQMHLQEKNSILEKLFVPKAITPQQKMINSDIAYLQSNFGKYSVFIDTLFQRIEELKSLHCEKESLKEWTKFYSAYHSFLQTSQYISLCTNLFSNKTVNHLLCGSISMEVRKLVATVTARAGGDDDDDIPGQIPKITVYAQGKIRYVGGRSVAKVKYHNSNLVRTELQSSGVILDRTVKVKVDLLQSLTVSQADVENTAYPQSTLATFRKQNLSCGLTNISDEAFEFFQKLEICRIPLYRKSQLEKHRENLLEHVHKTVLNDYNLYHSWVFLFRNIQTTLYAENTFDGDCNCVVSDIIEGCIAIKSLYSEIITSYLNVTDAEYRRKLIEDMGKHKTMEHRKQVLASKKKSSKSSVISIASLREDQSKNKEGFHLKLKLMMIETPDNILASFTKKDFVLLGKSYNLKLKIQDKKEVLMEILREKVLNSDHMPNPEQIIDMSTIPGPTINLQDNLQATSSGIMAGPSTSTISDLKSDQDKATRRGSQSYKGKGKRKKQY